MLLLSLSYFHLPCYVIAVLRYTAKFFILTWPYLLATHPVRNLESSEVIPTTVVKCGALAKESQKFLRSKCPYFTSACVYVRRERASAAVVSLGVIMYVRSWERACHDKCQYLRSAVRPWSLGAIGVSSSRRRRKQLFFELEWNAKLDT